MRSIALALVGPLLIGLSGCMSTTPGDRYVTLVDRAPVEKDPMLHYVQSQGAKVWVDGTGRARLQNDPATEAALVRWLQIQRLRLILLGRSATTGGPIDGAQALAAKVEYETTMEILRRFDPSIVPGATAEELLNLSNDEPPDSPPAQTARGI